MLPLSNASNQPHFAGLDLVYNPRWGTAQFRLTEAGAKEKNQVGHLSPPEDDEVRLNGRRLGTSKDVLTLSQRLAKDHQLPEADLKIRLSKVLEHGINMADADSTRNAFNLHFLDRALPNKWVPVKKLFRQIQEALQEALKEGKEESTDPQTSINHRFKTHAILSTPQTTAASK